MARACWCEDFVYRAWFTIGRMAPSRASFVLLRDELLEWEAFDTLLEAKVLFERWRQHYNTTRPHSALGYRPPAPEAWQPRAFAWRTPQQTHGAGLLEGKILT